MESACTLPEEKCHHESYPAVNNPVSYKEWLAKTCSIVIQQWHQCGINQPLPNWMYGSFHKINLIPGIRSRIYGQIDHRTWERTYYCILLNGHSMK
ncbi:hypothetical protein I79_000594 [Cricetulus griseus]|uniref:Uncharacterized protein n=1 Tax=Cricetulus griseus TaxID=10029 RepID=G3GSI0_CRIGR|nr:hypothetical protein I79_000594 [Cricetulus griseus]